jgi:hypothetical protein
MIGWFLSVAAVFVSPLTAAHKVTATNRGYLASKRRSYDERFVKSVSRKNGSDINKRVENSPLVTQRDWY